MGKMREKIVIVGITFSFIVSLIPASFAQLLMANEIEIPDIVCSPGDKILIPVNLINTMNGPVQTIMFDVEYNDGVIELVGVNPGDLTPISEEWQHILGENKKSVMVATTRLENAIPNGSTGSLVILNFSVIGEPSDVSSLNISDLDMSNTNLQHGIAPIKNGTLTVNSPPDKPSTPSGPLFGYAGISYSYSTSTTDPNNDQIKYGWDWDGDDIVDEWTGLYNPGSIYVQSHSWSSAGIYYVKVKARDENGDESDWSSSLKVVITVCSPPPSNHPPTVSISNPLDGQTISGTIMINGTASDPDGNEELRKVEIKIDNGSWITVTGKTSWSYEWDTTTVENGNYTIYAKSYDGEKYSATKSVTVKVENNHPPIVNISSPLENDVVKGKIIINGIAWDLDNDTLQIKVRIDESEWQLANGITNWTYEWDTATIRNGEHVIVVNASDGKDYSHDSVIVTVNNKKEKGGIPGFEVVFAIVGVMMAYLVKKRK